MAEAAVVRQVRAEVGKRAAGSRQCVADDEVVCHICEEPASGCVLCVCRVWRPPRQSYATVLGVCVRVCL